MVEAELERKTQDDAGIPHSHFKILALLAGADRYTMGLTRLSRALRFHKSRLSHAFRSIEAAGLLRREDTPEHCSVAVWMLVTVCLCELCGERGQASN
ncbi:hypothetical protein GCM10027073_20280 [Streptomyces chlorus]